MIYNMNNIKQIMRKGKTAIVGEKDLQHGDIVFESKPTDIDHTTETGMNVKGRRSKVIAIGNFTKYVVHVNGQMVRVPQWVVMDDGRALKFNRLFEKDGTATVNQGEFIFPGGAVFQPTDKTKTMEFAEKESRAAIAAAKTGLILPASNNMII